MNAADEAVLFHERLIGRRAIGRVRPHARSRVAPVEQALAQPRALIGGRVGRRPFADETKAPVDRDVVLIAKTGIARSTGGAELSSFGLALVNFTVQRASRSFWRSLAGLSFQF